MIRTNFISFLMNSFTISVFIFIILGIKKVFGKHISAKWQNNTGFLFLIILGIPFIPSGIFDYRTLSNFTFYKINMKQTAEIRMTGSAKSSALVHAADWVQDFGVSANHVMPGYLILFFIGVWVTGILVFLFLITAGSFRLRQIRKSIVPLKDGEMKSLFDECCNMLKINRKPVAGTSDLVHVPVTAGVFRPYIILPKTTVKQFSQKEIKYIFLHELNHYKSKDVLINWIMMGFQTIYWFNPLVWLIFRQMRMDREVACDALVLKSIDEESFHDYGYTIINFITKLSESPHIIMTASLGGTKKELRNRIKKIAVYTKETTKMKIKGFLIFTGLSCFLLSQIPAVTQMAYSEKYNFHGKNIVYEDLSSYFKGFDGSFVLYNMKSDQYVIYNKDKSITRSAPDSTYKIYDALIGLELGIIKSDDSSMKWDGRTNAYRVWNQDQNLESALKNSVNWYFQEIDKKAGKKQLYSYYKKISYGNYNISGDISSYWMESSVQISPVEQVLLLKNLYTGNLAFSDENIKTVKNALKLSENNGAVLSGKTGTGSLRGKNVNGWFVGFVEKEDNVYIFAVNIQAKNNAGGKAAAETALAVLRDKNIY